MAAETPFRPASEQALCDAILDARGSGTTLALTGGGSKARVGRPAPDARVIDMRGFAGVLDYDPEELVLTVGAGTPLAEIEALVASREQMLAFAPFDHGPIFGRPEGASTIGGVLAAGVAGSQRVSQGSARDHLLGFRGVSGRGEPFVAGAKVVKNVTGYDLSKLVCGSWGRLVALTEVTLKVLPRPRAAQTVVLEGLPADRAVAAMARALGSQASVSAAAHLPATRAGRPARTALLVEGFAPSVKVRCELLVAILGEFGRPALLAAEDAAEIWADLRTLRPLAGTGALWRVNVAPRESGRIVAELDALGAGWLLDWGGGLIWTRYEGDPQLVRALAQAAGGHATLFDASDAIRAGTPSSIPGAFHPPQPGVAALEERVRRAFDPDGVFETGRF